MVMYCGSQSYSRSRESCEKDLNNEITKQFFIFFLFRKICRNFAPNFLIFLLFIKEVLIFFVFYKLVHNLFHNLWNILIYKGSFYICLFRKIFRTLFHSFLTLLSVKEVLIFFLLYKFIQIPLYLLFINKFLRFFLFYLSPNYLALIFCHIR